MFKLCKLKLLLLALVTLSLASCQKENLFPDTTPGLATTEGIDFKINQTALDQIALNEEDSEDERINLALLEMADQLSAFAMNSQLVQFVVEKAKTNEGLVFLEDVFVQFPEVERSLNTGQSLGSEACPFEHTGLLYKAAIMVPNFEIAFASQTPIISPGIELYDDVRNDNPDIIFAWHFDQNGQKTAIYLGEKEAMQTTQPLIVLTPELCDRQAGGLSREDILNGTLPALGDPLEFRMGITFSTYEYQINHRYDKSNNSEFWCQSNRIDQNGNVYWINSSNGGRYKIDDVHKNDIGTLQYKWMHFADDYTPYTDNVVYYNTWERDWYSSSKSLGSGSFGGTTVYYSGKRKYQNEWYSFNESNTLNDHAAPFQDIVDNWTQRIYFDSSKGYFNIWKIQH